MVLNANHLQFSKTPRDGKRYLSLPPRE